jgi:DNA-binding CsgD family transcriptional regulator
MTRESIYQSHLKSLGEFRFTLREMDILAAILHNRGEKKIAGLLCISPETVSSHVHNIMLKIGSHSKDGIIDFIEKTGKVTYLKHYYQLIIVENLFRENLRKIKIQIAKNNYEVSITFPHNTTRDSKEKIIKDLEYGGIIISDRSTKNLVPKKTLLDNIDKDYFEFLFDVILEITNNKEVSQIYIDFKKRTAKNHKYIFSL